MCNLKRDSHIIIIRLWGASVFGWLLSSVLFPDAAGRCFKKKQKV